MHPQLSVCPPSRKKALANSVDPDETLHDVALRCAAGYICMTGSNVATPTDRVIGYICPVGYYCLEGAVIELACAPGTYQQATGKDYCDVCPAGTTCPYTAMNATLPCPAGYYCPNGTVDNGEPCLPGTFNPNQGVDTPGNCLACLPGKYCDGVNPAATTGNCSAGYLCLGNATTPTPNTGNNKPCPVGHYCLEGTSAATPCPHGTLRNSTHGKSVDDCLPCTGGKYCNGLALVAPSGPCAQRYYCPAIADVFDPQPTEFLCPTGSYCPADSADPVPCNPGTYQDNEGEITCDPCPAGYYCPANTTNPIDCGNYSYCPQGSRAPTLCPNGTFNDVYMNLMAPEDCKACTAGKYCTGGQISGPCQAGFICWSGIGVSNPDSSYEPNGGPCDYGFYCVEGTQTPETCPPNQFINKEGAASQGECQPCPGGRICPENSTVSEPCWAGYYCMVNESPAKCWNGTYNSKTGMSDASACLHCPPGYFCDEEAIANYTTNPCPLGYFCPNATIIPEPCPMGTYRDIIAAESELDCFPCPGGSYCPDTNMTFAGYPCVDGEYCPEGAQIKRMCKAGYFCNNSETQISCPPAYYCPENSTQPTKCPRGSYCTGNYFDTCNCTDAGAIEPTMCPPGWGEKIGAKWITLDDTCAPCRAGYYSAADGSGCLPCRAGVVCLDKATMDNPVANNSDLAYIFGPNGTNSYICPPGYYCPEASGFETGCPTGTYNYELGMTSLSDCIACPIDHFNHLTGQTGCFFCGGEAKQPHTGQASCECSGNGRDFQETDRQCPCAAGFKEIDGDDDCIKDVLDNCGSDEYRFMDGSCLNADGFKEVCSTKYCKEGEYKGFIAQKGICLCKADDLEALCNTACRKASALRMQFVCSSAPKDSYLQVQDKSGNIKKQWVSSAMTAVINAENALTRDQCDSLDDTSHAVHFMISTPDGFLGVYEPDADALTSIVDSQVKTNLTGNATDDSEITYYGRRRLLATTTYQGTNFTGITNPIICLKNGEFMMWAVDNTNYPVYDRNNLFNTNSQFDYGGFRALAEAQAQVGTTTTLFAYQFNDPGTYVFYSSADQFKKMYISVMQPATQCAQTGPFFPVTTSNIVSNGIGFNQDILQAPDWPVIFILLGAGLLIIILMVIALVLFRKYGWLKDNYLNPFYRDRTLRFDFDNYASKGSTVYPVRKYHRNMTAIQAGNIPAIQASATPQTDVGESVQDEFWDYDRQVDLEGFSSRRVYDTLARQSRAVTMTLGKQKDEVKQMYQKVAAQTDSLKALWAAKMNLQGTAALATEEDIQDYERKLSDLEHELARRKEVGHRFQAILNQQEFLAGEDEKHRESHQVNFQAALREAHRTLKDHTEKQQRGQLVDASGKFDTAGQRAMENRVSSLISKMSTELTNESGRLGCWGVLGQGTGAQLLNGNHPMSRDEIFGKSCPLVETDKSTGLLRAKTGSHMLLGDGSTRTVPEHNFIHPQTGNVLPVQGNVAFDPVTSRLVFVVDSATGEAPKNEDSYIPFVPYPTHNGQSVRTKLEPLKHATDLRYGAPMSDPETSLHVPILAVTIHPSTGAVLPVGGTHIDIVTGLPTPIEVGSLMVDPNSGLPVPILAVALDNESGEVVPVGGVHPDNSPILPGQTFTDTLSGKRVRVHGGHLATTQVQPSAGGYQALLNSTVLACEARVNDAIRAYLEALSASTDNGVNVRHEEATLESAIKELENSRNKMKVHLIRTQQDIKRRQERASILATTGGSPGMYEFEKTGQVLPILVGTTMTDTAGSGQEVPILGAEKHRVTGKIMPLGGTMEDPEGAGLVPISIGKKAIDPISGELSPVIGVRLNAETDTVVPITLSSSSHRKKAAPPGAAAMLEEEIVARRGYWRRQRQREEEITAVEHNLAQTLLRDVDSVTVKFVARALEEIDSGANSLAESGKREVQRRGAAEQEYSSVLPPEVVAVLTDCDARECEMEEGHVGAHVKFADAVRKFFNKLQQEEKKYKDKMEQLRGGDNDEAEHVQNQRYRQAKDRLLAELQDQIITRVENLDEAHSALEYARQRSELCCQEAKVVLTHSALLAGDYDAQLSGVYGDAATTETEKDSELVPLLKQLIAMLESGGPFYLSSELLNVIKNAAGGSNVHTSNVHNINIGGEDGNKGRQGGSSLRVSKDDDSGKDKKKVKAALVKSAKEDKNEKKRSKSEKEAGDLQGKSGANSEAAWKELVRKLFERQAYEAAKLENDLKSDEINGMQDIINETERKKKNMMNEAREDLRQKLEKCDTEKERDKLMADYAVNLQKVNDAFDKQKNQQLETLRKKLLESRRTRRKDLYRKHCEEAQAQGVGIDSVPDVNIPGYDDLMRDLLRLQEDQERALAEMQREGEKARNEVEVPEIDNEFERAIRKLDVDDATKQQMIDQARQKNRELQDKIARMKDQLQQRKDRVKLSKLSADEQSGLAAEDQEKLIDARRIQSEADREREELALLEARRMVEKEQQRLAQEQALRDALRSKKEDERDRILALYQSELDKLVSRQDDARQAQRDKIVGKLAARKRLREEVEKEQAVARELDRITKRHVTQGDQDTADVIMDINEKVNGDNLTPEQVKLLEEQELEAEKLESRQRDEQRGMNRTFNEEMVTEEMEVDNQIQEQKRLAVAEQKNKFDRDMLLNRQSMTEEEYRRLLADHQRELEALVANMDLEKDRQKRAIKDKILERRKKRDAQLEEKHRLEMEEEMTRQQQKRDKLNDQIARQVEDAELKKNVKNIDGDKAENLIYTVLRQRHLKEAIHLEDQLAREMAAAKRRARAEVEQSRQKEREVLMQAFEQEMMDLVANSKGMSEEELNARKQDLKREQKRQRLDFDKLTEKLVQQAEKDITPKMEIQQTHQRLELKGKQLQELSDAMQAYSPSEEMKQKYAEEARLAALEAERFRNEVLRKMEEEFARRKKEEEEREAEKQRKLEEHYRRLQAELEDEQRREEQRLRERDDEKFRLRQKQLEERRKNEEESILKSQASESEKQRLLREHESNMEKLRDNFMDEQERSKMALASKLAARKKKRHGAEYAKFSKQMQMEEDNLQRKNLDRKSQESQLMGDNSANKTDTSTVLIGELPTGVVKPSGDKNGKVSSSGSLGVELTGNQEQDWVNLLMASPLFKQINDLADMLEKSEATMEEPVRPHVKGGDYTTPYIDVKDAQWTCRGDLSPVDIGQISSSQFVVYRFGVFVIKLLHEQIGTPETTLLLASNLPPNNYERNAFRNSIYYEHARNILFVRKERIDSIGEFVVLILHSMAHVKCGEMTDDGNAQFLRVFYKCLKVVCQDMFFSRTKSTPTTRHVTEQVTGQQSTNGRPALEQALAPLTKKMEDRTNTVGELVDMKVETPGRAEFSPQQINRRMYGYENMSSTARLRQYLESKGGYLATSDFIANRMNELRGSGPLVTSKPSHHRKPPPPPPIVTQRDVVDTQLVEFQTTNDALNEELADVLKMEAGLREGIRHMEQDSSQANLVREASEELEKQLVRKNDLLKRIATIEADISKKEKELRAKK
ncbi:hypothetical protein DPMN_185080 [Dreissena polymorpha]|uniref:Uncharacterized protein n=1 Tax=Dreissena polymorpha TaxID=45954 RepID=A0A9D4DK96_DREPO|nr:hypothetical protein DPMN_185080 [Dreissena polymorpha]